MVETLPKPPEESVIYEDSKLYVCFALYPFSKGHTVVVWKKSVRDIHFLSNEDYDYLMDMMDVVRDALLRTFNVEKVYLLYMDEIKQVHWHLVPRFDKKGINALLHSPKKIDDFPYVEKMKKNLDITLKQYPKFKKKK